MLVYFSAYFHMHFICKNCACCLISTWIIATYIRIVKYFFCFRTNFDPPWFAAKNQLSIHVAKISSQYTNWTKVTASLLFIINYIFWALSYIILWRTMISWENKVYPCSTYMSTDRSKQHLNRPRFQEFQ